MIRPALLLAALAAAAPTLAEEAAAPLTLERAVGTALTRQPQVLAARAQTRAARARTGQAVAALLPQGTATAGYTHAGPRSALTPVETWSAGVSGTQLLWDFGQAWGRAGAARAAAEGQAETERSGVQGVILAVQVAWFQAAAARDLVAVARETLANREAHLRQVEAFVKVGTRPEIDLAQARADRSSAVVQLIGAENDWATTRAILNQAMGVAGSTEYELAPTEMAPLPGEDAGVEALLEEALGRRPDVAAQLKASEAQRATLRAIQGQYGPTLAARAGYGRSGTSPTSLDNDSWNLGLTLNWSFFEGGRTRAAAQEASATLDALAAGDEGLRQQIRLELEEARLAVRAARASLEADRELVVNAKERLRLADARYQAGLGSGLELNDAQVAFTSAQAQEVTARFQLATARARLAKALGRTAP